MHALEQNLNTQGPTAYMHLTTHKRVIHQPPYTPQNTRARPACPPTPTLHQPAHILNHPHLPRPLAFYDCSWWHWHLQWCCGCLLDVFVAFGPCRADSGVALCPTLACPLLALVQVQQGVQGGVAHDHDIGTISTIGRLTWEGTQGGGGGGSEWKENCACGVCVRGVAG